MKTKLSLLALLVSTILFAQNGINYKAIIKDANGNVVANDLIQVQFSILQGIAQTNVYQETHTPTTDENGLIIVNIGEGTTSDDYNSINWSSDEHFLNVQVNIGSGLVDIGVTAFKTVPYAKVAENVKGLEAIDEGNGIGWRLVGRDVNNYGIIGNDAIDFSESQVLGNTYGATGDRSMAIGVNTTASGLNSFAIGIATESSGAASISMGSGTIASGDLSLAIGQTSIASGYSSRAMGLANEASGNHSTAIGNTNIASGVNSIALGLNTLASAEQAVTMGRSTTASGDNSIAMGYLTEASGDSSTAIGRNNIANSTNAIAMGYETTASGYTSTAIGRGTEASSNYTFASGYQTVASSSHSTAMGFQTAASGLTSIAIGRGTEASGNYSTAMGFETRAIVDYSTAIGRYNIGNGNFSGFEEFDPLFIIGNGTSDLNRNNALTVDRNGTHTINSNSTGLVIYSENSGISVLNPGFNGLYVIGATNYGANIEGAVAGLSARSSNSGNPDIILRGNSSANTQDDGIISSDPSYSGSDIYLRSNDALVIQLDHDDNGAGNLFIQNSDGDNVFSVNESGTVNMGSRIDMTFGTIIDNFGAFVFDGGLYPDQDNDHVLGSSSRRWTRVYATDGTINTSDRRDKTNIANLNYGLKDVMKLQPISFNWKTNPNDDTKLGLIAQDLLKVIPEVVKTHDWETDENGNKIKKELERMGVYYSDLVPVLIKAIQEQQKIIDNEKSINSKQNSQLEALLSRIEILESNASN